MKLVALPSEKSTVWMRRITVTIIDACCSADLEQPRSVVASWYPGIWIQCVMSLILIFTVELFASDELICDPVLCNWYSWNMYIKETRQFRNKILAYLAFLALHKHTWLVSLLKDVIIKAVKYAQKNIFIYACIRKALKCIQSRKGRSWYSKLILIKGNIQPKCYTEYLF